MIKNKRIHKEQSLPLIYNKTIMWRKIKRTRKHTEREIHKHHSVWKMTNCHLLTSQLSSDKRGAKLGYFAHFYLTRQNKNKTTMNRLRGVSSQIYCKNKSNQKLSLFYPISRVRCIPFLCPSHGLSAKRKKIISITTDNPSKVIKAQ